MAWHTFRSRPSVADNQFIARGASLRYPRWIRRIPATPFQWCCPVCHADAFFCRTTNRSCSVTTNDADRKTVYNAGHPQSVTSRFSLCLDITVYSRLGARIRWRVNRMVMLTSAPSRTGDAATELKRTQRKCVIAQRIADAIGEVVHRVGMHHLLLAQGSQQGIVVQLTARVALRRRHVDAFARRHVLALAFCPRAIRSR